jgi:ribosome-binding ATPase
LYFYFFAGLLRHEGNLQRSIVKIMGFTCGIVGLPNVGKSTLFNVLVGYAQAETANYPFCTVNPNVGLVPVPDIRLNTLAELVGSSPIPSVLRIVDIAGLVKGASQGEGLGNLFLAHVRDTQALLHVVRCFDDPLIQHVQDSVDPIRDVTLIEIELMLSDLALLEKIKKPSEAVRWAIARLSQNQWLYGLSEWQHFSNDLEPLRLISAKPFLYVLNVQEQALSAHHIQAIQDIAEKRQTRCIVVAIGIEHDIQALEPSLQASYRELYGYETSGLAQIITAGYQLLGLSTFFTAGPKEVRAWDYPNGAYAQQVAGVIHTDFEKRFIRMEVVNYDDFIRSGGWSEAKRHGLMRVEGKHYQVKSGDIINVLHGS